MQNMFSRNSAWPEAAANGLGHLIRVFGTKPPTAAQGVLRVCQLQGIVVESSRLSIPAIAREECLTWFESGRGAVGGGDFHPAFGSVLVRERRNESWSQSR